MCEGWREGRTLRTRVGAIVYLVLSPAPVLSSLLLQWVQASCLVWEKLTPRARTVPLGVIAWALLAASSGWDAACAALLVVAVTLDSRMWAYVPSFLTYAVGKWIWLGKRGKGYFPRLLVAVGFAWTVLGSASSSPLRVQVGHVVQVLVSLLTKDGLVALGEKLSEVFSLYTLWIVAALAPSAYLLLRASHVLRPSPGEPATHDSIPATVRLLPIALTATTAAIAISLPATSRVADTALPLLPLALASSLRGDDDEWAVAVQAAQVANIAMWPALAKFGLLPLTIWAIGWSYVVGAKRDAPDPILRIHQMVSRLTSSYPVAANTADHQITTFLTTLAPFMPLLAPFVPDTTMGYLKYAQEGFIVASLGLLILWANIRLLKSAWAIGAL